VILGSLRRVLAEAHAKRGEYRYLDRIFGNSVKQFVRAMHQRDRVNVRAISNRPRALRPPLDVIHDRAYELFNIRAMFGQRSATYAPMSDKSRNASSV
jgi:hypothetical protein